MERIALIWDLDGTLIDSYPAIMEALAVVYEQFELPFDRQTVQAYVLQASVGELLESLAKKHGENLDELKVLFHNEQIKRDNQIQLLPHAKEVLAFMQTKGILNLMYTHKGETTQAVLEQLGLATYFTEVLTAVSGFARKPDPEAIHYLLDKYQLEPENTYYIGDRPLDVEVAVNSGINSINLTQADSAQNKKIKDLSELLILFKGEGKREIPDGNKDN